MFTNIAVPYKTRLSHVDLRACSSSNNNTAYRYAGLCSQNIDFNTVGINEIVGQKDQGHVPLTPTPITLSVEWQVVDDDMCLQLLHLQCRPNLRRQRTQTSRHIACTLCGQVTTEHSHQIEGGLSETYAELGPSTHVHILVPQLLLIFLIATLKLQSNGPSHSNTVIGTLAVDGWAVTFSTARSGWAGPQLAQAPPHCTKCNNLPSTASVPTSYYSMWHYNCLWSLKG